MVTKLLDDPVGVPDDTVLYRRTDWGKIGGRPTEPDTENLSITKNFFTDAPQSLADQYGLERACMSVGVSSVLGSQPERMLANWPNCGLVSVTAGELRRLRKSDGTAVPQGVMLFPTEAEPWHAVVFTLTGLKRDGQTLKAIAALARIVVPLRS